MTVSHSHWIRPEPPPGSVVSFWKPIGKGTHQFVALGVENKGRYITGQFPRSMSWLDLCHFAAGCQIWVLPSTGWTLLP